jgi:hypothetical protein
MKINIKNTISVGDLLEKLLDLKLITDIDTIYSLLLSVGLDTTSLIIKR